MLGAEVSPVGSSAMHGFPSASVDDDCHFRVAVVQVDHSGRTPKAGRGPRDVRVCWTARIIFHPPTGHKKHLQLRCREQAAYHCRR